MFEGSKHLAFYPVRFAQIVHMLQYETSNSEPGSFDGPRERVPGLLLLQLMPHGIKDGLQPTECFRAARTRTDLHETTPIGSLPVRAEGSPPSNRLGELRLHTLPANAFPSSCLYVNARRLLQFPQREL